MGLIDLLVKSPGRWILILCVGPHKYGRYVQLLVHEDGSILAEACSNNYLEGSDRLSSEEEAELVAQGDLVAERLADWLRRHPDMEGRLSRRGARRYATTDDPTWFAAQGEPIVGSGIVVEKVSLRPFSR